MRSVRYGLVFETFEQHKYKHGFVLMSYVSISVVLYAVHLCFLFMSGRRTKSTTKESKKKKYKEKKSREKKSRKKKKSFVPSGIRTSTKAHPRSEVKYFIHLAMESQVYR